MDDTQLEQNIEAYTGKVLHRHIARVPALVKIRIWFSEISVHLQAAQHIVNGNKGQSRVLADPVLSWHLVPLDMKVFRHHSGHGFQVHWTSASLPSKVNCLEHVTVELPQKQTSEASLRRRVSLFPTGPSVKHRLFPQSLPQPGIYFHRLPYLLLL